MRHLFPGYYRPTEEEFSALWRECVFAFDANVLLNVYRYSQATRERFLDILGRLRERIWLPYQAAFEYQENRLEVLHAQYKPYDDIPNQLDDLFVRIKNAYKKHPVIPIQQVLDAINSAIEQVNTLLNKAKSGHPDLTENDDLRAALDNLFAEKVGVEYTPDELRKIYSAAQERFNKKIPPGYKDDKKDGDRKYGDVILWYQLKDYAKQLKKPLVLVTDDKKDDWWQELKGKTIGPRPELIQEMKAEAGIQFYIYQSDRFMEYAQKYLGIEGDHAVEEVREIMRQDKTNRELKVATSFGEVVKILESPELPPVVALMALASEIENELQEIIFSEGQIGKPYKFTTLRAIDILEERGTLPTYALHALHNFTKTRNKIAHGRSNVTSDEILSAIDSGSLVLSSLKSIPRLIVHVHHPGVTVYSNRECTQPIENARGVILEMVNSKDGNKDIGIYPSTRTHFVKGKQVAWEWDDRNQWGAAWYRDPDTNEIKSAWGDSLEFVGRNLEDI